MLDDPHVLALLPLPQKDLLAVRAVSQGCRLAAETVLAQTGIALRLATNAEALRVLHSPRWRQLRALTLRGISLRLLCVLGTPPVPALPAPHLPRLASLDVAYVQLPLGFLGAFPALQSLKLTADFFVSTYADALALAREALQLAPRLRTLDFVGKGVTLLSHHLHDSPLRHDVEALRDLVLESNTLARLGLRGGQVAGLARVDAPLEEATIDEGGGGPRTTLEAASPRVHAHLKNLTWTTSSNALPALRPCAALARLDVDVRVDPRTNPADAVRALGLALPGGSLRRLRVALDYGYVDADSLVVRWPGDALAHLRNLQDLYVEVSFPPRGADVLEEYLWGAPETVERVHLVSRETRCHQLREELRQLLEDDEADPEDDDVFELSAAIAALEWYVPEFMQSTRDLGDARPRADITLGGNWVFF